MSYINANTILPKELIIEIQKYVHGINVYIPKIPETKKVHNEYKNELDRRNKEIYELFRGGTKVAELAKMYYLSDKSIYRIIRQMKK